VGISAGECILKHFLHHEGHEGLNLQIKFCALRVLCGDLSMSFYFKHFLKSSSAMNLLIRQYHSTQRYGYVLKFLAKMSISLPGALVCNHFRNQLKL